MLTALTAWMLDLGAPIPLANGVLALGHVLSSPLAHVLVPGVLAGMCAVAVWRAF